MFVCCVGLWSQLSNIEDRYEAVTRLERQLLELHELMRDFNTLVELQQVTLHSSCTLHDFRSLRRVLLIFRFAQDQMTLEVISERIHRAELHTSAGEQETRKAKAEQSTARKTKGCIIGLLAVILGPVLGTQLAKR